MIAETAQRRNHCCIMSPDSSPRPSPLRGRGFEIILECPILYDGADHKKIRTIKFCDTDVVHETKIILCKPCTQVHLKERDPGKINIACECTGVSTCTCTCVPTDCRECQSSSACCMNVILSTFYSIIVYIRLQLCVCLSVHLSRKMFALPGKGLNLEAFSFTEWVVGYQGGVVEGV